MVTWSSAASLSDEAWDEALLRLEEASVFQSSAWARHKAASGWSPVRLLAGPSGSPAAALQALAKAPAPGLRVLWARGGPAGAPAAWGSGLAAALAREAASPLVYARACPYRPRSPEGEAALAAAGFSPCLSPLDRPLTLRLGLSPVREELEAGLSTNWRHNLRRGKARALVEDWPDPDPAELEDLYRRLESYKGLSVQHRAPALAGLLRELRGRLILKRVRAAGRTVALRACAVFGARADDLLAAADPEGRRLYASYPLLWELVLEAKRRGARVYDLGGADPEGARGVYDFKRGTGGAPAETLGEWDFARPGPLRRPLGALASRAGGAA